MTQIKIPTPVLLRIGEVHKHELNVKEHPEEQINNLMKLIKMVGFKDPIVIDKDNIIWAGHGRLEAAYRLDMEQVPCIYLEDLSESQKKLFMYMDNQINESPWVMENVKILLGEIPQIELEEFQVDFNDILGITVEEEQYIPEIPAEPKSKLGEVYQLGNHRVMCGDSTKETNKLLNGITVDLLLTDPPYGIDIVQKHGGMSGVGMDGAAKARRYKKIINDDKPFDPTFLLQYGINQIIFGANHFSKLLPTNSKWLVWDKKDKVEGTATYFSDVELCWTNVEGKKCHIYRHTWAGMIREGDRKIELKDRVHPTQKPVGLLSNIIKDYSQENHTILDCYLGSGSTLIACEQTNRICYGMELDPGYVDVIIQRWENFTGKKAELISTDT